MKFQKDGDYMKKTTALLVSAFAVANAFLLGLGMVCLLYLMNLSFAVSLDGVSAMEQYPRFFPFCVIMGILAVIGLACVLCASVKVSERLHFTGKTWVIQYAVALILSLPMARLWMTVIAFLRWVF